MALDVSCVSEEVPWSIITSAATNSSLAAVLAGLLIATIAVLYVENKYEGHTIALFSAGVVVLALDSYLFSHLTGIKPYGTSDERIAAACERAWLQAAPASGMLAVGAVALTCGLAWMMASYVVKWANDPSMNLNDPFLAQLGTRLVRFVIFIVTLLLASTSVQSLGVVWPSLPTAVAVVIGIVDVSVVVGFSFFYSIRPRRDLSAAIQHSNLSTSPPVTLDITTRYLRKSTLHAALFALLGPFFAGSLALYTDWLTWDWAGGLSVLVVGLFYPGYISVLMSRALPSI
ncbi:hypothetical protein [Gordonia sp. UCD-TK1]|uniref:hypothetical protein n=1 Tax=Gordonia sp. UCD-TK1 TaxID=1857893 RepID=UPI0011120831|nr:hypothetical protein [Gordonia sp. UCD-TK1]